MSEVKEFYSRVAALGLGNASKIKPNAPVRFRMYWSKQGSHWRVRIFGTGSLNGVLLFNEKEFGVFSSFALINTTLIEWSEERGDQ